MNRRKSPRRYGPPFLLLLAPALAGVAFAAEDPRAQATALLSKLTQRPEAARLGSEPIAKGQAALKRADQLRGTGDQKRAGMLEQTALEWAQAAELLDKTAAAEKQLAELQAHTTELETKVFRAQALVEQTVARRARAEEALRKLDEKGAKP
ncbi:MAG TPA: hypothetical protein VHB79_18275 [Polyangiaceae bacterium]|nr:hypothetical protein [Polyangiaceae bacterium]